MRREIINEIVNVFYPDDVKCVICGREIRPNRYGLCDKCSFDLNENYCLRCGRHKVGIGDFCGECADQTMHFDEARSSVVYDDDAKSVIWRLKYGSAKYLARTMAQYLLDTLLTTDWEFDCFTFVPIHKKRARKRGYNQAELLAQALSDLTTTPCILLLQKTVETKNQARLSRDERITNLAGSFAPVTTPPAHVVLVDDVLTTGSTVGECAKVLKRSGAKIVYVLTFASVPERPMLDKPSVNIRDFRR